MPGLRIGGWLSDRKPLWKATLERDIPRLALAGGASGKYPPLLLGPCSPTA